LIAVLSFSIAHAQEPTPTPTPPVVATQPWEGEVTPTPRLWCPPSPTPPRPYATLTVFPTLVFTTTRVPTPTVTPTATPIPEPIAVITITPDSAAWGMPAQSSYQVWPGWELWGRFDVSDAAGDGLKTMMQVYSSDLLTFTVGIGYYEFTDRYCAGMWGSSFSIGTEDFGGPGEQLYAKRDLVLCWDENAYQPVVHRYYLTNLDSAFALAVSVTRARVVGWWYIRVEGVQTQPPPPTPTPIGTPHVVTPTPSPTPEFITPAPTPTPWGCIELPPDITPRVRPYPGGTCVTLIPATDVRGVQIPEVTICTQQIEVVVGYLFGYDITSWLVRTITLLIAVTFWRVLIRR
jgi:hypothetical protein